MAPPVDVGVREHSEQETYLGDGLYASFDGFMIKLRAPDEGGDRVVYVEHEVFVALREYALKVWR